MKLLPSLAAALALTVGLAGCGAHPTAAALKTTKGSRGAAPTTLGAPLGNGPANATADVAKLLAFVKQSQAATPGFTATVVTDDHGPSGSESDEIKVSYKKPSTIHLNMIKATGQAQGASIIWDGSDNLQVKVKVGFLPITTNLSVSDAKVKSKNGWTIKQTDVTSIFGVLFDAGAQIKIVGQQPGDAGHMLTMVEVHSSVSPKPADREIIGIDQTTGLPGLRVLFQGQKQLYRLQIKGLKVGAPSSTEMSL